MKKTIPILQVDAFAHQPFSGNSAAVCLLDTEKDDDWMQSMATEMNLSETAFVRKSNAGFRLRWFTPTKEVDLCGHATLAAAHALWEQEWLATDEKAHFQTRSGLLIAEKHQDKIQLDFPSTPAKTVENTRELLLALDLSSGNVFSNQVDYLIEVDDEAVVYNLKPDFAALSKIKTRGVIVTALSTNEKYDFVSRFFAPAFGIDEDPVTGSAHCTLAPFWAEKLHKTTLQAFQASVRGGEVDIKLEGERVFLTGKAITIFSGECYV